MPTKNSKQRQVQEFQQTEDSSRLSLQQRQDTEEQQFIQPQPTLWDRGKKKPQPQKAQAQAPQPTEQYPEQPKTYEEAVDVLSEGPVPVKPTEQPTPVLWERGRKKTTTQQQQITEIQQVTEVAQQQFVEQQQLIEQREFVEETKKTSVRKTIAPREPEQKMDKQDDALQHEVKRLRQELKRVTEERDILKKAAAYFARTSG